MKIISLAVLGLLSLILLCGCTSDQSSTQPVGPEAVAGQDKSVAANAPADARGEHEERGDDLLKRRRFREAIDEFDAAIALNPDDPKLYVKKGIALYRGGKPDDALPLMDKAVGLIRDDKSEAWWPLYHKAMALGAAGDLDGAFASLSESIERKPNHENYSARALVYAQQGKPELALADVEAALKFDPNHRQLNAMAERMKMYIETKETSAAFLKEMAAKEGARKTASGLIYFELKKGDGKSPSVDDTVKVHYHGTVADGTVFDSSVDRKEPATFSLKHVIPCWTEGVQMMRVGGKAKLICPAEIAYGNRGAGAMIRPGEALAFEVELLGIE
ncbi:MAG TPA: FKBP-type peptidyl-prolyl cis-trans isomerase [Gammaproteobacteria bacterium]